MEFRLPRIESQETHMKSFLGAVLHWQVSPSIAVAPLSLFVKASIKHQMITLQLNPEINSCIELMDKLSRPVSGCCLRCLSRSVLWFEGFGVH